MRLNQPTRPNKATLRNKVMLLSKAMLHHKVTLRRLATLLSIKSFPRWGVLVYLELLILSCAFADLKILSCYLPSPLRNNSE